MGLLLGVPALQAQSSAVADTLRDRPRIGLALSGGGAKAGAQVGVLQILEELRIPVDCIAGTSVGALVGGGYASGLSAAEIREFVLSADWPALVSGAGHRALAPIELKRRASVVSHGLQLGVRGRSLDMPGGLMPTADLDNLLRDYVAGARATVDFDALPIPFRAVATDLLSGEMVALGEGDLARAIRASLAVPGGLAPVETEHQVLVDGGLVRNLPVDVVRELCADVVIAVTVMEEQVTREKLRTAAGVATRALLLMIDSNTYAQLETLTDRDVSIFIRMDVTTPEVDRIAETLPLGEAAARAMAGELQGLSLSPEAYAAWRAGVQARELRRVRLADIRFAGLQRVNPRYLAARTGLTPGDETDIARLGKEALKLFELGEFEAVEYALEGDPAAPTLVWTVVEKSWGPDYFVADLGLFASLEDLPSFSAYASHTRTWLNHLGGTWHNELQLGRRSLLASSLYQPLDEAQRYFVEPVLGATHDWELFYRGDERAATYRVVTLDAGLDLGVNLGRDAQVRVGYSGMERRFRDVSGETLLPAGPARDAVLWFGVQVDNRDSASLPTRGFATWLEVLESRAGLGADREWRRAEAGFSGFFAPGGHVLLLSGALGTDFNGGLPLDRAFALGGPSSFPGLAIEQLRGTAYRTGSVTWMRRARDFMPVFDQALYLGARLQWAWVEDSFDLLDAQDVAGAAVFATLKTVPFPVTLSLGTTDAFGLSLWLSAGRPVDSGGILNRAMLR